MANLLVVFLLCLLLTFHLSQLCRPVFALQPYFRLFPLSRTANEEEADGYPQTQVSCLVLGPEGQGNDGSKSSKVFKIL